MAVQDGRDAGQTVEHVHVHLIPRKLGDFERNDDIYDKLEKHDSQDKIREEEFRTLEEMEKEAKFLAQFFSNTTQQ